MVSLSVHQRMSLWWRMEEGESTSMLRQAYGTGPMNLSAHMSGMSLPSKLTMCVCLNTWNVFLLVHVHIMLCVVLEALNFYTCLPLYRVAHRELCILY